MCEIELTLRRGANLPRIEYGKDKVEEHKLEIQEIFNVLNPSSPPLDENFGMGKRASRLAPSGPQFTTKASGSKSGTPSALVQLRRFVLIHLAISYSTSTLQPVNVWSAERLFCLNSPP